MYVYVPPGFDCNKRYPLIIWLHGFAQDEHSFLYDVVPHLDRADGVRATRAGHRHGARRQFQGPHDA